MSAQSVQESKFSGAYRRPESSPSSSRKRGLCPDEPLTIFVWNGSLEGLSETHSIPRKIDEGHRFLPAGTLSHQREASLASCYVRAGCAGCAGWLIEFPRNSRRSGIIPSDY